MKLRNKKNPVCAVFWRDAACTNLKKPPKELPPIQLTTGFIMETNDEYINIATNVNYDLKTGEMYPVDGFVIPQKTIIKFKKVDYLDEKD